MPIPDFRADGWLPEGHHPTTWEEIIERFSGEPMSKRDTLVHKLLQFRDALKKSGCTGRVLLDGSFVSAKAAPGDFDVLLVLQPEIQSMKDVDPVLARLLDAQNAEIQRGYTVFFAPNNSASLKLLETAWDKSKDGVYKGVVEVPL